MHRDIFFCRRLPWSILSGVLAGLPYCVRNITATAFPGMMTITPICVAIILTTPHVLGLKIQQHVSRLIATLTFPAVVLFILVELYAVLRGTGPLVLPEQVFINDIMSLVEFICATISLSSWSYNFAYDRPRSHKQARASSLWIGFAYAAVCRIFITNASRSIPAICLITLSTFSATTWLAYHFYDRHRGKTFVPHHALVGFLLFAVIHLLAQGGDPYYGTGEIKGSPLWYFAGIIALSVISATEYLCDRNQLPSLLFRFSETPCEKNYSRLRPLVVFISLAFAALFLLEKCLAYILPLKHFSFSVDDTWTLVIATVLITFGGLLSSIESQGEDERISGEKTCEYNHILCLQMILLGLTLSDFRAIISFWGLISIVCFLILVSASGALENSNADVSEKAVFWLIQSLHTGIHTWSKMGSRTLLILPVTIIMVRCLIIMPNPHYFFNLIELILLCAGIRTLWLCRQRLLTASVSQKIEEADAARICREFGFGPLQTDVLLDTINGYSIKEICIRRNTTVNTVKSYRRRAYRALGVSNVEELKEKLNEGA